METWRIDYSTVRSHSSLAGGTPSQFTAFAPVARRLTPARPGEDAKPDDLSLFV
jgi:hypothetical protein